MYFKKGKFFAYDKKIAFETKKSSIAYTVFKKHQKLEA